MQNAKGPALLWLGDIRLLLSAPPSGPHGHSPVHTWAQGDMLGLTGEASPAEQPSPSSQEALTQAVGSDLSSWE